MKLAADFFPLRIRLAPKHYNAQEVEQLKDQFGRYFARGERYAVNCQEPDP